MAFPLLIDGRVNTAFVLYQATRNNLKPKSLQNYVYIKATNYERAAQLLCIALNFITGSGLKGKVQQL